MRATRTSVYVAISEAQRRLERMAKLCTVYHGLRLSDYRFTERKERYLLFLGRIAPMKGAHLAIDVARRARLPLKIAGEIQPTFQEYWDTMVRPHVDGSVIQYVGEADHAKKNALLGGASALLFPIQWNEPFGLVMVEAMACGTPVMALPGGSVDEVVRNGVSGWVCADVEEMDAPRGTARHFAAILPADAERRFSVERMAADYEAVYSAAVRGAPVGAAVAEPAAGA